MSRTRPPPHPDPSRGGYDRARDLPGLVPLWPAEIADHSPAGRQHVIRLLRRALRAERRRGIGGHWSYDLARHAQLRAALAAEEEAAPASAAGAAADTARGSECERPAGRAGRVA